MKEGDLNARLLKEGGKVFKKLEGFTNCVWARRIGLPGGEADFILLNSKPARLAIVECAGMSKLETDYHQIVKYMRFMTHNSSLVITRSILASLTEKKPAKRRVHTRAKGNRRAPLREWLENEDATAKLCKALDKAKKRPFVALLLVYHVINPRGKFRWFDEIPIAGPKHAWAKKHEWRLAVVGIC